MKNDFVRFVKAGALALFSTAMLFTACQVGLGDSVDTEAPKLAITYPPENAVIRSGFVLAGTCDDDGTISRVSVSLVNTSTGENFGPYSASVEGKKNWRVTINSFLGNESRGYNGYEIPDGTYTARVTITDDAGHTTGPYSRQFDIDNTAPIFVISSPQVLKGSGQNAKAYGSTLKISGTLADSHSVRSMSLKVFDMSGNQKGEFREEGIETTGGTNVSFAKYVKGSGNTYSQRYADIYGAIDNGSGSVAFTSQIFVEDSAKQYTNPEESSNETEGNKTSVVYLHDDIYSSLMSSAGAGLGLEVAQFIGVLNGTSGLDGAIQSTVKEYLGEKTESNTNGKKIDTAKKKDDGSFDVDNYLYFSLNPNAAPTYSLTGLSLGDISTSSFEGAGQAARGSKLSAQVSLSTNGTNLNPASFKTWIRSIAGDKSAVDLLIDKTTLYESYVSDLTNYITLNPKANTATIEKSTNWILVNDNSSYSSGSVDSSYTYPIDVDCGINANSCYIAAVTGEDVDGSLLVPSLTGSVKAYGFVGGQGQPPVLTEFKMLNTSKSDSVIAGNGYVAGSDHVKYHVIGTSNNGKMKFVEYEVKVSDSANSNTEIGTVKYKHDFSELELGEITGTNDILLHTIIDRGTAVDKDGNPINDKSILKAVSGNGKKEYQYALKVTIYDSVGMRYESSANSTLYADTVKPVFNIQSVKPTIEEYDASGLKIVNVKINGTIEITGSVTETNLKTVTYELYSGSVAENNKILTGELTGGRSLNQKVRTARLLPVGDSFVPVPEGKFIIKLIAEDIVDNKEEYLSTSFYKDENNTNELNFEIDQSTDKPSIRLDTGDIAGTNKNVISEENFFTQNDTLKVTASDDDGLESIKIDFYTKDDTENSETNRKDSTSVSPNGKTSRTLNYSLQNLDEGTYKVVISATDVNYKDSVIHEDLGLTQEERTALGAEYDTFVQAVRNNRRVEAAPFYIVVDNAAPVVTETTSGSGANTVYMKNGTITLTGTVVESNGLEKIVVGGTELAKTDSAADNSFWLSDASSGTYSWKKTFNFAGEPDAYTNGSRIAAIVATDVVGKKSSTVNVTIADEAAPVINETSSENAAKTIEFTGGTVTLSGTVVEENGLASLKIADEVLELSDTADVDGKYWKTLTAGTYGYKKTFAVKLADFTNGSRSFKIEAKDIAGKTSLLSPLAADTTKPVVTETAVTGELTAGVTKLTVNEKRTNGTFTVAGTITEKNGISGVTVNGVVLTKADVANGDGTYWVTDDSTGAYAYKKTFITGSSNSSAANYLADGNYSLEIKTTDTVGNIGTKSVSVTVDTTKPVWGTGPTDESAAGYDKTTAAPHVSTQASESGWYRVDELKISGSVSDNLTGIEKVEYSLDENAGTDANAKWYEFSGTNAWSGSISGLSTGKTIWLRATDIAGNVSSINSITGFQIDTNEPTIDAASRKTKFTTASGYSNGAEVLSNKKDSIDVVFNAKDGTDESGIEKVYISSSKSLAADFSNGTPATALNAAGLTAEGLTATDGYTTYKVTIAKTAIVSGAVYAFAYDNAGNYSRENLFTISVDETDPTVELNVPADADVSTSDKTDVNKVITLTGTASDETKLDSIVRLEYNTISATATTWTALSASNAGDDYDLSGSYSFTAVGLDTSKFADKKSIYVRAVAIDDAGNLGYSNVLTLYVNQDSDRPQVKINNLTQNGETYILKYGTNAQVTGTLSDDDSTSTATVSKFIVSETEYDGTGSEPANIATYTPATGDFTIEPSDTEDGIKTFYIYIEDNDGNKFFTTATAASYMENPKISVKGTAVEETVNTAVFSYSSDGTNPIAQLGEGLPYASNSGTPAVAKDDDGNDFVLSTDAKPTDNATLNSSFKVGGISRRYVKLHFVAIDVSGIEGMTLEIANENGVSVKKLATAAQIGGISTTGFTVDGTFTANGNKGTWDTGFIDLKDVLSGQCTVKLTPYDKAGLAGNGTYSFYVDNDAPEIVVRMPANGERVTGDVSISGSANDRGTAGTVNIQWRIPTTTEVTTASSKSGAAKLEYLKGLNWNGGISSLAVDATVNSWQFDFDGKYDPATSTVVSSSSTAYSYNAGNPNLTEFDKADFAQNADHTTTSLYKLPIYFMATDNLGNFSVKEDFIIEHNPDGDKPNLKFSYPTKDDYDVVNEVPQNYVTLGGTIRVTGGAEIPSGTTTVKAVYYQIAGAAASFNATDKAKASQAISMDAQGKNQGGYGLTVVDAYTVINGIAGTSYTTSNPPVDPSVYGFKTKALMDEWWGIKANGGASWNVVLNNKSELNPTTSGTTNNIALRACGVNAEGKFGAWTTGSDVIAIHIDDTAPTIAVAVNKYGDGTSAITAVPSTAPTASHTYESDMYLKGNWTLALDVLDETAVTGVTVKKGNTVLTENTDYYKASYNPTEKSGFKVYIPISRTDPSVEYTVTAQDSNHLATQSFSFNIDEIAPTLDSLTGNGTAFDSADFESIENNNYVFTVGGKSLDEGSGVERVVFYYMRKSGETKTSISNQVILDPMITTTGSNYDAAKVALITLTKLDVKQGANTYSLYAKNYSGSATTESFTSGTAYDAHVRVGGLIFIDGAYRKITAMSGNTVDFTPSLTEAKASVTASFPIAQVIDNSATEKTLSDAANPFTFEKGDDGDLMPESFSKSGKTWTWDASIHSDNMPDGPVSLVILAFDAAGNVNGTTINTKITNNAPRLAKVWLGTDLSGDGKFSNTDSLEELVEYNILGAEGKEQSTYTLDFTEKLKNKDGSDSSTLKYPAGIFTIKNGLAVVSEFTGGNGEIGMVTSTTATSAVAVQGTVTAKDGKATIVTGTNEDGNTVNTKGRTLSSTVTGTFTASNESNAVYSFIPTALPTDGTNKGMSFTFWDSTDETTQGQDSQNSVLYVKNFTVNQTDNIAPTVVINPLYWNSVKDNSIYDSSAAKKVSDLKGHIELEKDWIAVDSEGNKLTGYDGNSSGTYLDSDPKISGKVRFTGTAYDNVRLKSIAITFSSISGTAVATYNKTTSSWTVPATTLENQGYVFSVSDATKDAKGNAAYYGNYEDTVYFGQQGHKIYWTLDIDTAKITDVAAKDISLIVKATDDSNKTTADSTASNLTADKTARIDVVDGTINVSSYRVDVVPYITGVITSLSSKSKKVSSVYDRSALGHYPIRSNETITLKGFNLTTTSISASNLTSGEYKQTVNGVETLNNINYNNSVGQSGKTYTDDDYAYCYNRQPNGLTNEELTDDIYFDVWEFKKAATTKNGKLKEPVMKINPNNNMIGFAFANGSDSLSLPKGNSTTKNSYTIWQKNYADYAGVNFVYDANGYAHSVSIGLDTEPNSGYAGRMQYIYSPWGGDGASNMYNWNKQYTVALESVGIPSGTTVNGSALTANLIDIERFGRPTIGVSKVTTTRTDPTVYMAYYDSDNDQIRFRYGTITQTNNRGSSYPTFDQINDSKNAKNETIGNSTGKDYGKHAMFEAHSDYYSLLAGGNTGNETGEFVALDVVSGNSVDNDVVVIVWYDGSDLKYTYRSGKKGDLDCNSNGVTANAQHGAWSKPETIFSGAGQYCAIKVDDLGGIHIAAYERAGADLYYAYMSSYSDFANLKTALVDSYSQVGKNISIDTAKVLRTGTTDQYNVVPYITYYADGYDGLPKYAYLPGGINKDAPVVPHGATDATDEFTGDWEVEVIPTSNEVNEDNMNVAIWKDSNGIMTASTKPASGYTEPTITAAGTNSATWYGNGTSEFVLGYGITVGLTGFIETAQMKF